MANRRDSRVPGSPPSTMPISVCASASRHNAALKTFRDRLIAAGQPKLVALIATARKLITIVKDGAPWQPA